MKILFLLGTLIINSNLFCGENSLEFNVDYSQDNFIVITASKTSDKLLLKDYHIVQREESLEEIAEKYKILVEDLEKINKVSRFDNFKKNEIIYLKEKQGGEDGENKK